MKTMKKGEVVKRVNDTTAEVIKHEGWEFCPKSEFKTKK